MRLVEDLIHEPEDRGPYAASREPVWATESAIYLARMAHVGATDKGGYPYIGHPQAVARLLSDNDDFLALAPAWQDWAIQAAWLHDTLEDTKVTASMLYDLGCPLEVVDLVRLLTHERGVSNAMYWAAIKTNHVATLIKRADVAHNMHPSRLGRLDAPTRERLMAKYTACLAALA